MSEELPPIAPPAPDPDALEAAVLALPGASSRYALRCIAECFPDSKPEICGDFVRLCVMNATIEIRERAKS